jgi:hypothetical protein
LDRFLNNTLRTLGIVVVSIFVIVASLILLLLAICMASVSKGGFGGAQDQSGLLTLVVAFLVFVGGGIFVIIKLSRGIVRETSEFRYEQAWKQTASTPPPFAGPSLPAPPPTASAPPPAVSAPPETDLAPGVPPPARVDVRRTYDVAAHLSPTSRLAIRDLALAVGAKIAAEIFIAVYGWTLNHTVYRLGPIPGYGNGFLAWGLGAVAPMIVLLYALLRHPGPRAFAYSLVIPAIHLFFGFFGHSATLIMLFRRYPGAHPAFPLLSLIPWLLDIVVLRLAWKAIRLTGIQPNSARLMVASAVIFIYNSLLPALLLIFMNYFLRTR